LKNFNGEPGSVPNRVGATIAHRGPASRSIWAGSLWFETPGTQSVESREMRGGSMWRGGKTARRPPSASSRRLGCESLETRCLLAITVDTLVDEADGSIVDGDVSLRDAIASAPAGETINFDALLDGGTIRLTLGELYITRAVTLDAALLSGGLTIDASGNDPTPAEGNGDGSRVFRIDDGKFLIDSTVTVVGLTITGGDPGGRVGAIDTRESLILRHTLIAENWSGGISTGIVPLGLNPYVMLTNSTIAGNRGGGIDSEGDVLIEGSTVSGNSGPDAGGINTLGSVTVIDSTISDNNGAGRSGISALRSVTVMGSTISGHIADFADGGGIQTSGDVTVSDSTISGNSGASGGGIHVSGAATIMRSTISGNSAGRNGGGIRAVGDVAIDSSTISGNSADDYGGGIDASGDVTIVNSTISDNSATFYGGGIHSSAAATVTGSTISANVSRFRGGGGISSSGFMTITSSTVSGNLAEDNGGGIHAAGGLSVTSSTVTENRAGEQGGGIWAQSDTIVLQNSIVAANANEVDGTAPDLWLDSIKLDVRFSMIGDNTGSGLGEAPVGMPDADGNLIGGAAHGVIDPELGPLSDNGGPTETHALLPGRLAINAGDVNAVAGENGVPEFDQRGEPFGRVFDGRIDIGAYEYQSSLDSLLVDTLTDESDGNHERGDMSLREAVQLANLYPGRDTIRFDPVLLEGGPAIMRLTMGEMAIADRTTIEGFEMDLLTIDASGNDPTPDEDNGDGSRIFNIDGGEGQLIDVEISGVTISGGDVIGDGGAILSRGNLRVTASRISGNSTSGGSSDHGGAIYVRDGILTIHHTTFSDNSASGDGGAVRSVGGHVLVTESTFSSNQAGGDGGAVSNSSNGSGSLIIRESTISGNSASRGGGGIWNSSGDLTVTGSTLSGNSAGLFERGGAIFSFLGNVAIADSTIRGNSAGRGGGIWSLDGIVEVTACSIRDNSAGGGGGGGINASAVVVAESMITANTSTASGGGISGLSITVTNSTISANLASGSGADGGGISAGTAASTSSVTVVVTNSTISGNSAAGSGGGIYHRSGSATVASSTISGNAAAAGGGMFANGDTSVRHSTVALNSATAVGKGIFINSGQLSLDHSIVALNLGTNGDINRLVGATVTAQYSLVGNNQGSGLGAAPVGAPDINGNFIGTPETPIDPGLGPLSHNGGPTMTRALLPGSPARDAGDPTATSETPDFDQRGSPFPRIAGGRIDMGAFEVQSIGDMCFDGTLDYDDIEGLVLGLRDAMAYEARYGVPPSANGDTDGDGAFDFDDITGFVALLGPIALSTLR
jgi:predicted outer membrane repeat protein